MEITIGQVGDPQWHTLRSHRYVTGSNWPAICGFGYHSRAKEWDYVTKKELRPPQNAAMERGSSMEDEARHELSVYLRKPIVPCGLCEFDGLDCASSPDGLVVVSGSLLQDFMSRLSPQGTIGCTAGDVFEPCEIKCPLNVEDKNIGNRRVTSYWIQCHAHMLATNTHRAHLWIYTSDPIEGPRYKYYLVERDLNLIHLMLEMREEFLDFIRSDTRPPNLTKRHPVYLRLKDWETSWFREHCAKVPCRLGRDYILGLGCLFPPPLTNLQLHEHNEADLRERSAESDRETPLIDQIED